MTPELVAHPSMLALAGFIVALASLLLNVFIVPGGIYLMRAFVREEIKLHDGTEHAHPNLKAADRLGEKLDELGRALTRNFDELGRQINSLRLELSEGMAKQSQERHDDIEAAIRDHEGREVENNKRILEEAKAIAVLERRKK